MLRLAGWLIVNPPTDGSPLEPPLGYHQPMQGVSRAALVLSGLLWGVALAACGGAAGDAEGGGGSAATSTTTASVCASPCGGDLSCDKSGDGTYYAADGSGNCSFEPTGDLMVAAMNHTDYAGSAACGACVRVSGPSGEVTVRVVDQCPECSPGDIDLSPEAFVGLAPLEQGRIPITWRYVECDESGPIAYHFKEGSNPYWTAVQIRNARNAIATVEARRSDGSYSAMTRQSYNYFLDEGGLGDGPYAFRVTDVVGNVLEDEGVAFIEGGDSLGAAQFPSCAP